MRCSSETFPSALIRRRGSIDKLAVEGGLLTEAGSRVSASGSSGGTATLYLANDVLRTISGTGTYAIYTAGKNPVRAVSATLSPWPLQ